MTHSAKTFADLSPPLRSKIAEYIKECRQKDRGEATLGAGWICQTRSLDEYCQRLGIIRNYLDTLLQLKIETEGSVSALDVGVGHGGGVQELAQAYGKNIHLSGLGLTPASFRLEGHYTHRIGLIETIRLKRNAFDFIFSVRGGFSYTLDSFAASETTLNSLKMEGMAFLEDRKLLFTQEWFRNYLKKAGFDVDVTRFEAGNPVSFKIVKKIDRALDLSPFNEKYLSHVERHGEEFLKWGFDRLREGSPLTALFQEFYSEENYADLFSG